MKSLPETPTSEDHEWLVAVMGRPLDGDFQIASRTQEGRPQVLRVPPIINGKPFPSLYWLCCPDLKKRIDHLEARGEISTFENLLKTDSSLRESLRENHQDYVKERWSLVREDDLAALESPNMIKSLQTKGIGGLGNWQQIRCLHMHYAFHLIRPTRLGGMIDALLEKA